MTAQRQVRVGLLLGLIAIVLAGFPGAPRVSAHPELRQADPPADGLLAAPPRGIELWTTEAVDEGAGSPSIRVLDESGSDLPVRNARVDPADGQHVTADVDDVGAGTFTVVWSLRSAVDGHTLSGSFAFRVGTGRAPGAATVQGESPRTWAVATRWLTFLGMAVAAAGFLFPSVIFLGLAQADDTVRRRRTAIVLGAAVALIATLADPVLQTRWPPEGAIKPSLSDAIAGLPDAWWLRLGAAALTLVIGLVLLVGLRGRNPRLVEWAGWAGAAAALAAILGLSLTSHASARESWRVVAMTSDAIHQWSVALWVGGLAHLALSWSSVRVAAPTSDEEEPALDPVRRFSRYALVLVALGVGTGIVNAGFVLPRLRALWDSSYGEFLIAKVAILLPVLGLATFHRLTLRRAMTRAATTLRSTVWLEAALVLLVVLVGSILALLAPPVIADNASADLVDLAAPVAGTEPNDTLTVRLQVEPAMPGNNEVTVLVAGRDGAALTPDQVALVRLDFASLNHEAEQRGMDARPTPSGGFATEGVQLSLDGWWQVDVLVRRPGVEDITVPFFLMLPDPNVNGENAVDSPDSTIEARQLYERGLTGLTSLHTVHYSQRLSGGTGTVVVSNHLVNDGSDGSPPASALISGELEMVTVGDRQWLRRPGDPWTEREASPIFPPSAWAADYEGATDFQLGRTEEIAGEMTQMVSFKVPAKGNAPAAWFAWWVGQESGQILQETMVSNSHYMVYEFRDFNQPLVIAPPDEDAPGATPASN